MVVLDGHGMLGTGPNQYLQPDYLSPLPTTLDAKKSPLALLAQTCSQIGADTPSTKSLLPSLHSSSNSDASKRKSSCSSESSSSHGSSDSNREGSSSRPKSNGGVKSSSSSSGGKSSPSFKPYESASSFSKPPTVNSRHEEEKPKTPKSSASTPPVGDGSKNSRTTSPAGSAISGVIGKAHGSRGENRSPSSKAENYRDRDAKSTSSSSAEHGKTSPAGSSKDQGASPIIRSGLEVLHGHMGGGKDFGKHGLGSLGALAGYPPGFDPTNPALRPPFFPPSSHHAAAAAAAAAFMGYPPATGAGGSPYVGYTRVKTPSGAETIVPVCKDPYCTGCQFSMPPGLMAAAAASGLGPYPPGVGVCPAGCVQCDHQKFPFGIPFMPPPGLSGIPTSTAASLAAAYSSSLLSQQAAAAAAASQQHQQQSQQQHHQHAAAAAAAAAQRPYVCSWIVGDSYCGKRFPSSEELLQHLRTHTNLSSSEAQSMTSPSSLYSNALLNSSAAAAAAAAAAMHRTYPTPPLSPLSAARYHPYASGKPLSSLVQQHPPSLASYYPSPYSALYGQRIGPPVHP